MLLPLETDRQAPSHLELAFRDPLTPLLPGHFTASPVSLASSSLALRCSVAHQHLLRLLAPRTSVPLTHALKFDSRWLALGPVCARGTDRPSPRRELKEFKKKVVQTAHGTAGQAAYWAAAVYAWPALFIPVALNFPALVHPGIV